MGVASTSLLVPTSFAPATVAATAHRSFFSHRPPSSLPAVRLRLPLPRTSTLVVSASASPPRSLDALIFDCDGVILESEHLHRQAYNDAFAHFGVRCPPAADADTPLYWDEAFYDDLQNRIGGGKPKMRWYVTPASSRLPSRVAVCLLHNSFVCPVIACLMFCLSNCAVIEFAISLPPFAAGISISRPEFLLTCIVCRMQLVI
jgi:hypothetical protein